MTDLSMQGRRKRSKSRTGAAVTKGRRGPAVRAVERSCRRAIVILGMHRSGTSALTRILGLCGGALPNEMIKPTLDNVRGYWEPAKIVRIHDEFLAAMGYNWYDPVELGLDAVAPTVLESFEKRLREAFRESFGASDLAVLKDPRICRFVPLWISVFNSMAIKPLFVILVRSPLEVAASVQARNALIPFAPGGMSEVATLLLWLRHFLEAERYTRGEPRVFVSYEQVLDDWRATVARISSELAITWPVRTEDAERAADEFLSVGLRHHVLPDEELDRRKGIPDWVRIAYRWARAAADGGSPDVAELDQITDALRVADAVFMPIVRANADNIAALARNAEQLAAEKAERCAEEARLLAETDERLLQLTQKVAELASVIASARELERQLALQAARERELEAALASEIASARELEGQLALQVARERELEAANASQAARRDELEAEIESMNVNEQQLQEPLIASPRREQEIDAALMARNREYLEAQQSLAELHASTSWRITAPLRSARRLLTRLRHSSVGYFLAQIWPAVRSRSRAPLRDWRDARIVAGSRYFDSTWYLMNNPDVAAAGLDPAVHYASQGWREGRNPGPAFDTRDYLAHNRDVERVGVNPLAHFVRHGAAEARMGGVVRPAAKKLPPEMTATAERLASDPRPVILMLLHESGGGTEIHVRRLATMLGTEAIFLMLKVGASRNFALSALNLEDGPEVELQSDDWDQMCAVLRSFDVRRVHVHHTFGFLNNVQGMLRQVGVPYDLTIHDFMLVCPRMFLYRNGVGYCGEPDAAGCLQCLREEPPALSEDILWWRWVGRELIEGAERVICPSQDAATRIRRYASRANLVVAPHEDRTLFEDRRVRIPRLSSRDRMRVAVLGVMTGHKGVYFLLNCIAAWKAADLNIDVTLIGESLLAGVEDVLRVTGRYEEAQLPSLIADLDPHLVFYPQQCPETYSYTLSEGLYAGMPILAPDLGAFRERVEGMEWCWLYNPTDRPEALAELLRRIRVEYIEKNAPPPPIRGSLDTVARESTTEFYRSDYLRATQAPMRTPLESAAS